MANFSRLQSPFLHLLLPTVQCSFLDQSRDLLQPGGVNRVTGAGDFALVAVGSRTVRGRA